MFTKTTVIVLTVMASSLVVFGSVPALGRDRQAREDHFREDSPRNIHHVNQSILLAHGTRADTLNTVNGSITIGDRAEITSATTVNGSVRIGDDSRARTLGTVNGRVSVGERSVISGNITSVNGRLQLDDDAVVQGDARNVNSEISLGERARVGGWIVTRSGDITLSENARVDGGIRLKRSDNWLKDVFVDVFGFLQRTPVVTIGPGAEVAGDMVFDNEVELRVHSTAKIGKVSGAKVRRY